MTDTTIAVIGAGLAGLGAAHRLQELDIPCIVLEASDRIGGRAWTTHPPQLGGGWFDMGAVWLHNAEQNPLVPMAEAAGETLLRSDELRREYTFVDGREAMPAEYEDYAGAWRRFENTAGHLLHTLGDVPLSDVAKHMPGDPWALTVECWEGPVICAVEAHRYSLRDWRQNVLSGGNMVPQGGIGAFVQRRLGQGLDIRLDTPVISINWHGPGGRVSIETARGTLTARACIVTVSTGVLLGGGIRFDPPLPARTQQALDHLPMGLAMKVALRAAGPDRLDLPPHCSVDRQITRPGEPMMIFQCWPYGRDYVQGWIGGDTAWDLAKAGDEAAADFALSELRRIFGARVDRLFAGRGRLVTRWDADPLVRGAYSFVPPGHADARHALAERLDGPLLFAGEACHDGLAGTLAGAWISGRDAAATTADGLQP